ncbi:hypothetical protein [Roseibium album]|uniref:hypothetical protein n=1 Tax=Roseibium album TaxID=311410 RepID=UPI00329716D8
MTTATENRAAALAEKKKQPDGAPIAGPEIPTVDPAKVHKNNETTMYWKEWIAWLPADMSKTDLQHPEIWRRVQANRHKSFGVRDKVTIFSADESFYVEARVWKADTTGAWLRFNKISEFREALGLWKDDMFELRFYDGGFHIHAVATGALHVARTFHTESDAIATAMAIRPRVVGDD